ncbi:valine--tRNA ligase [Pyrus ussuriensis x Pyrus communis]|uniref:Valine--tRNA ligase n=1 Tax=Pyrus ussuriensis x Pyrus communis TaxID=2448454 RepID=A0A5N5GE82_9ROSA|nr:valine--tRNA ligase [Pyrus ussuriensis x Pyrus communis]
MVSLDGKGKGDEETFPRASSSLLATIYSSSQSLPTICLLMHQSLIFDSQ